MKSLAENKSRAFSLVEMLIVVAIMGILAGITIPQLRVGEDARAAVAQRNLDDINTAVESYRQLTGQSLFAGLPNPSAADIRTRIDGLKSSRPDIGPLRGMGLERQPFLNVSFNFTYGDVNSKVSSHRGVWNGSRFILIKPSEEVTGIQAEGGAINLE
jgi:prepilin-type N-terminal cleavage/methylation domain-containing protein